MNFIGNVSVGDAPRIVAVIAGKPELFLTLALNAKNEGADILEFRADYCTQMASNDVRALLLQVKEATGLPVLLTIRRFSEGGYFPGSELERFNLFDALIADVEAIDVELYAKEIQGKVVSLAHSAGKLAIVSYHNFLRTPPESKLDEIVEDAEFFKADMVKIAVSALTEPDVSLLSRFTAKFKKDILLTTISMGEVGTVSRILNPFLGSALTYAFVGKMPTTPGQIRVRDLRRMIDDFADQELTDLDDIEDLVHAGCESSKLVTA